MMTKFRVLDEQKGRAAQYSARLLVMDPGQGAVEAAIRGYLWPDEWFTQEHDVVQDEALQMSKVVLRWQPRRMVVPRGIPSASSGNVLWGLWWCGPSAGLGASRASGEIYEHLWMCGLMVKRNRGVYPEMVMMKDPPVGEMLVGPSATLRVRGYERDEYPVQFQPWGAVPDGYLIME
jgi:hypothetical protein